MKKLLIILIIIPTFISVFAEEREQVIERVNQYILEFSETEDLQSVYNSITYLQNNKNLFNKYITDYYFMLTSCYKIIGDYRKIIESYQCYNRLFSQEDKTEQAEIKIINILNNIGVAYTTFNQPDKAEEIYLEALNRIKKIEKVEDKENLPVLPEILLGLGITYANLYNYPKALFYLRDAKYVCEKKLNFGATYSTCIGQMALCYVQVRDYLNAKIYNDVARDILLDAPYQKSLSKHWVIELVNASHIYEFLGYSEEAMKLLGDALQIIEKHNLDGSFKKYIYTAQGSILLNKGNYVAAKHLFHKIDKQYRDIDYYFNLSFPEYLTQDKHLGYTAKDISQSIISDISFKFSFLSSQEREVYWKHYNPYLQIANYFLTQNENFDQGIIYNNALFSKGLLLFFRRYFYRLLSLLQIFNYKDGSHERRKRKRPHNQATQHTAKANTRTCKNVGKECNTCNNQCVRQLRFYVFYVITLRTCRRQNGGIGNRRDVIAENRTAKRCRHRQNNERTAATQKGYRNRYKHPERSPRRTRRERDYACKRKENCRE